MRILNSSSAGYLEIFFPLLWFVSLGIYCLHLKMEAYFYTHDMCATEIKIATFLIRPNSLLEEVCMHSFKSSNIVGHFQRWAANSYPPA